jgi:RNA-directed DNA polymerase
MHCPRKKSLNKFKDEIRERTRRNNGNSLEQIIHDVNAVANGWSEYFKHSNRTTFETFDKWIRMRLRSILPKRQGRKGRERGNDKSAGRIRFFTEHGLFSMYKVHAAACQPARR